MNCDGSDDFDSVWRKIFEQLSFTRQTATLGFSPQPMTSAFTANDLVSSERITTESVRRVLQRIGAGNAAIVVIDEFDRLKSSIRRAFGDLVKTLSDHAVPATVVLVGVADSIDDLIEGHESVGRATVQIQMPRMKPDEIREILYTGVQRLQMTIDADAVARIVLLSQGLPHYAHLVARHAARAATDRKSRQITLACMNDAISKGIDDAQHTIRQAYHNAIRSPQKGNLFANVLLSCALARQNEIGEFSAPDVRETMRRVTGKDYEIPSFAQHLKEFSDTKRGNILRKIGQARRFRYRFSDPLMQPYVIMQGLATGQIDERAFSTT